MESVAERRPLVPSPIGSGSNSRRQSSAEDGSGDPSRVPLTLRVGITGHRAEALSGSGTLAEPIRHVLKELVELAGEIATRPQPFITPGPPVLRLISSLASGADQFVAREALSLGFQLHAPLPFERKTYLLDFGGAASGREFLSLLESAERVLELDGERGDPLRSAEGYLAAGRVILHHCDVLVAIWDGETARGPGGTGQIVKEAAMLEIPVIWIHAESPHDVRITLGDGSARSWTDLRRSLGKTFQLTDPTQRERLVRFQGERVGKDRWWWIPAAWHSLVTFGARRTEPRARATGTAADASQPLPSAPLLARVDAIAQRYANLYRSAFLANFILAATAVFFALLGFVAGREFWSHTLGLVELAIVMTIYLITRLGGRSGWHARWLDYRLLAEQLRQVGVTAPLGRVPAGLRASIQDDQFDPRGDWTAWLVRAIVRHEGFPHRRLDPATLEHDRRRIDALVAPQIDYHRNRHHAHETIHRRLHRACEVLFGLTALAILIHLVGPSDDGAITVVAKFVTVCFPALGAALAGILGQGEYLRSSAQSHAMAKRLEDLQQRMAGLEGPLTSEALGRIAEELTQLLSDDLLGWRVVFRGKALTVPT